MSILKVDTIQNSVGTNALLIDSAARVARQNVPAFTAWNRTANFTPMSGDIILNTIILNNGSHYSTSTGNFTAPIAGLYFFSFTGFTDNTTSGSNNIEIRKGGSTIVRTYTSEATSTHRPFATQCVISLAVGETVRPWSGIDLYPNQNPVFSGFLL